MGQLEDLQFALGEGPCHDAFASGELVSVPDLAIPAHDRWPHYTASARELGARGVFAFPVTTNRHRIGVLTLYQDLAGPLSDDQLTDSRVVATVLAETMISIQSRSRQQALTGELSDANAHRTEVHQASGMAAIQLNVGVDEALSRIRAHAFATEQSVGAVARSIVSHTLRLNDDRIEEEPG
jgi:hypothetical protein